MLPNIRLTANGDGSYDIIIEYSAIDVEFSQNFDIKQDLIEHSKGIRRRIYQCAKRLKIRSVRILLSGALIATIAYSSFISALAASDRYLMGYLYTGTDIDQIAYVDAARGALDVVSPSYFDIRPDGTLKLNYLSPYFIKTMHDKGIRVVPFLSNHWHREGGIAALRDPKSLAKQLADYIEEYDLDGINVDIENVTHNERDAYTELVRLLREYLPDDKEVSVAVAANPHGWQTGWHGSYDYEALAKYADHLMIMAYDEHYEGSAEGPVAGIEFVEASIEYALRFTTPDKIVLGVPFYGRIWSLDDNRIVGKGVGISTVNRILAECENTISYDSEREAVRAEFVVGEGDEGFTVGVNTQLLPGRYVVWYDDDRSYQAKLALVEKYNLKGAGAWALGQEDTAIWDNYEDWVNGGQDSGNNDDNETENPDASLPDAENPDNNNPDSPSDVVGTRAWVTTETRIYRSSRLRGRTVALLPVGVEVEVIGEVGKKSILVSLPEGITGYIASEYLTFTPETYGYELNDINVIE